MVGLWMVLCLVLLCQRRALPVGTWLLRYWVGDLPSPAALCKLLSRLALREVRGWPVQRLLPLKMEDKGRRRLNIDKRPEPQPLQ